MAHIIIKFDERGNKGLQTLELSYTMSDRMAHFIEGILDGDVILKRENEKNPK